MVGKNQLHTLNHMYQRNKNNIVGNVTEAPEIDQNFLYF